MAKNTQVSVTLISKVDSTFNCQEFLKARANESMMEGGTKEQTQDNPSIFTGAPSVTRPFRLDTGGSQETAQTVMPVVLDLNVGDCDAASIDNHIIDIVHPHVGGIGFCRGEPLTNRGKKVQMLKILSLTLLPILGLWAFTVYSLSDSIQGKTAIEQTQYAVKFSVELGKFLDRLQRERDMSVLYLSILGPETKTFILNEYLLTDQALKQLSNWPVKGDQNSIFTTKDSFKNYLSNHRAELDPNNFDIYVEMEFYSLLIERFVEWMYEAIRESNMASIWKTLVAYQKIVTGMEHVGIERALGAVFYVAGGFPKQSVYERYNEKVHVYKANYQSAVLYSKIVDPIFQEGVTSSGTNLTSVIEKFRFEIQHTLSRDFSITKGQWWFDNMTLYLDTLLVIQQDLATLINGKLEEIINEEERNLIISAGLLVVVILMCPLVIYSVESLTSDIQKYALTLVEKTKELSREKKKTDTLLYQMVPKPVAEQLKLRREVDAEYFKSVTVMFSDIFGFTRIANECTPFEIVGLLNSLYTAFDEKLDNHEVYKVETINDSYMVASGLPTRIGNRHSLEVAALACELMDMTTHRAFSHDATRFIQLRIGINTGPCMAGIVGLTMPRYCLFGDTVNTASRMKSYGHPNKIHVSSSTYKSLKKHGVFVMKHRGNIEVKGKGSLKTYWLIGRSDKMSSSLLDEIEDECPKTSGNEEMPGEILPNSGAPFAGKLTMFMTGYQEAIPTGYDVDESKPCSSSTGKTPEKKMSKAVKKISQTMESTEKIDISQFC
ncbi:hypothetical protein LOTGIDRAFT_152728 [Lottia gigantea]|uniref:guanylate cyclase n=1 Tax=Lottia gigantea TaxID=225164 RepID=V4AKK2_LOTGI|nr:hypothetical protein LOTGIDRAFT_152728 [Lottia gigantea]ESO97637.1 hypothetical protein LOTGIDRAFT_152728 [Lottia gigantea]